MPGPAPDHVDLAGSSLGRPVYHTCTAFKRRLTARGQASAGGSRVAEQGVTVGTVKAVTPHPETSSWPAVLLHIALAAPRTLPSEDRACRLSILSPSHCLKTLHPSHRQRRLQGTRIRCLSGASVPWRHQGQEQLAFPFLLSGGWQRAAPRAQPRQRGACRRGRRLRGGAHRRRRPLCGLGRDPVLR